MTLIAKLLTLQTSAEEDAVGDVVGRLVTFEANPGFVSHDALARHLVAVVPDDTACREVLVGVMGAIQQRVRIILVPLRPPLMTAPTHALLRADRWDRNSIEQKHAAVQQIRDHFANHSRPHTHARLVNLCNASATIHDILNWFESELGPHAINIAVSHASWLQRLHDVAACEREYGQHPPPRATVSRYVPYLVAVLDCLELAF